MDGLRLGGVPMTYSCLRQIDSLGGNLSDQSCHQNAEIVLSNLLEDCRVMIYS